MKERLTIKLKQKEKKIPALEIRPSKKEKNPGKLTKWKKHTKMSKKQTPKNSKQNNEIDTHERARTNENKIERRKTRKRKRSTIDRFFQLISNVQSGKEDGEEQFIY